jgi:hypothetical protein
MSDLTNVESSQDPRYKQVRVANFQCSTVKSCVELMQASGRTSWATIQPHHVLRRVGLGISKPYDEIFDYLQVKQGELLDGKGPESLLRVWNNHTKRV